MIKKVELKKDELIKKVEPNFIYNRFDLRFNDYDLLEVTEKDKTLYIPVHVEGDSIHLGIYLTPISQDTMNKLMNYIHKNYQQADYIVVRHSLNPYGQLKEVNHWTIKLPSSEQEYEMSLGQKTRHHIRRYFRLIERDFECEFKTFDKNIPDEVVETYFRLKKETMNHHYKESPKDYLRGYYVTKAHVLYLNGKIAAISFISESDSDGVYFENFSYDKTYAKYSLGTVICYYTIQNLIKDGCKNFYMAGGDYLYKKTLGNLHHITFDGKTRNGYSMKAFLRDIISVNETPDFYLFRLFGIKMKKRKKNPLTIEFNENTKCLMVGPHADDEMLGAGGILIKYGKLFDCVCMGSSGVAVEDGTIGPKARSELRKIEFNEVMDKLGVQNRWIYTTYGVPRFDRQMDAHFEEYCNDIDTKQYDYIFLPHPKDGHHEHRYITRKLFKRILKKNGFKDSCKIVFYEVWEFMKNDNLYFDETGTGTLYSNTIAVKSLPSLEFSNFSDKKSIYEHQLDILDIYKSQWIGATCFDIPCMKKCKNNNFNWHFHIIPIKKYIK